MRADPQRGQVLRCDRSLELDPRQVDDLQNLGVDRDPLAGLGQALCDQASDRCDEHRVGARLAGQFHGGQRGLQRGLGSGFARCRTVQRGGRNKALGHQGLVVGELSLGNLQLRARRSGLLLGLAQAPIKLGRVELTELLAGAHGVPFSNVESLDFSGHAGLDESAVDRPQAA